MKQSVQTAAPVVMSRLSDRTRGRVSSNNAETRSSIFVLCCRSRPPTNDLHSHAGEANTATQNQLNDAANKSAALLINHIFMNLLSSELNLFAHFDKILLLAFRPFSQTARTSGMP